MCTVAKLLVGSVPSFLSLSPPVVPVLLPLRPSVGCVCVFFFFSSFLSPSPALLFCLAFFGLLFFVLFFVPFLNQLGALKVNYEKVCGFPCFEQ